MKLIFNRNSIQTEGFHQLTEYIKLYIRGYIIWGDKIYEGSEFSDLLLAHYQYNNIYDQIEKYNGCYHIVLLDEEKGNIVVINDRWGVHPLFYYQNEKQLIISTDWHEIIPFSGKKIREDATIEMICFGYVLGDKTLINGIYEFSPHSYYHIFYQNEKLQIKANSYWHLEHNFENNRSSKLLEKDFVDLWESRMRIYREYVKTKSYHIFIPLTAGLDSRLLATEMDKVNLPIYSMTFGDQMGNYEIETARQIVGKLNNVVSHNIFYLNETLMKRLLQSSLHGNRITCALFGELFHYYQDLLKDECSVFLPGHSGGFMAGGHIKYKMLQWKRTDDVKDYIIRYKSSPMTQYMMEKSPAFRDTVYHSLENTIPGGQDHISTFIRWNVEQLQRRYIIRSTMMDPENPMQVILPYYDYRIMDFFLNLPVSQLLNKRLKINALVSHIYKDHPEMLRIKNNQRSFTTIRNNFVHEYGNKLRKKMSEVFTIRKKGQVNDFSDEIEWKSLFEKLNLPSFIDKSILDNKYLPVKIRHYYNISQVINDINNI